MRTHRLVSAALVAAFAASLVPIGPASADVGERRRNRPPRLGPIKAVFIPDGSKPAGSASGSSSGAAGGPCAGSVGTFPPDGMLELKWCATHYRVEVPKRVGQTLEVGWKIRDGCGGTFTEGPRVVFTNPPEVLEPGEASLAEALWWHPHKKLTGSEDDCDDEYPHPGGRVKVRVESDEWQCRAEYEGKEGLAEGTLYPDLKGLEGKDPDSCSRIGD